MQVSVETTSGLERKLTIGIPAEVVDQEVTKRLQKAAKTVRINGFRKGKVPFKVVKQRFGEGLRQEVIGDTINRSFYEAVQKESLKPAGQPAIEPKQMDEGKDVEYVATFEVYPEIDSVAMEGIKIVKQSAEVTDTDIDNMIENLRKGQATWSDSEAAAKQGSRVTIDFEGKKEGEAFAGGSAQDHSLELGSGAMIPGFESGIEGMKVGESKALDLTFPEDYQAEELKGAEVTFTITVKKVEEQLLPELDDAFFEKFGVTDGGEEKFREDVKANMEREKEKALKNKVKDQVLKGLLAQNSIDVPKALVQGEIDALRQQTVQQYGGAAQNLDLKSLLPDEMFAEQAKERTALGLVVAEIVAEEKIEADKEVVKKLVEEAAASYEDPQEVVNYYYSNEQLLRSVEAAALEEQVVDLLISKSDVENVSVSYDEAIKPLANDGAE